MAVKAQGAVKVLSADELRLVALCAPQLLKLLEAREERILNRIYGEWRSGKTKHLASLAEWVSVRDQLSEIKTALRNNNEKEEKRHADASSRDDGTAD